MSSPPVVVTELSGSAVVPPSGSASGSALAPPCKFQIKLLATLASYEPVTQQVIVKDSNTIFNVEVVLCNALMSALHNELDQAMSHF